MEFAVIRDVFINNLLPVLLCASTGFVLGRTVRPDIKAASNMAFHIFSPCLVFVSLKSVRISGSEFGKLALFTFNDPEPADADSAYCLPVKIERAGYSATGNKIWESAL
ncbi:MAG: hypothetical protein JXA73_06350 [Acidobacteria bacterium]|nr:hypothetical protein [Acidobacteriota bacterium]